jgi:hypothetical protein
MIDGPLSNPFKHLGAHPSGEETTRYAVRPREHRVFHTALDASDLFTSRSPATVTWSLGDGEGRLSVHMPVATGEFTETCKFTLSPDVRPTTFERALKSQDRVLRQEHADLSGGVPKLPDNAYPETMLPFLLRGHPLDDQRRSLHAWICDRFVAKVYYEVHKKRTSVTVPAGRFEAAEIIMYPDINDWVKLGGVITKLIKPFLPKYHMWFSPGAGAHHKLVRFEGSYGPPGAPEIVLELL